MIALLSTNIWQMLTFPSQKKMQILHNVRMLMLRQCPKFNFNHLNKILQESSCVQAHNCISSVTHCFRLCTCKWVIIIEHKKLVLPEQFIRYNTHYWKISMWHIHSINLSSAIGSNFMLHSQKPRPEDSIYKIYVWIFRKGYIVPVPLKSRTSASCFLYLIKG